MTNRDSVPTYDKLNFSTAKALIALGGSVNNEEISNLFINNTISLSGS